MADFTICFILCNILISCFIGILLAARRVFQNVLTSRMQYHLWFLLLALLAVPFIPLRLGGFSRLFARYGILRNPSVPDETAVSKAAGTGLSAASDWMNDFAISVNSRTASLTGILLSILWLTGIFAMSLVTIRSAFRLRTLKRSALPLQNQEVRTIYKHCLEELRIRKRIPVYSTAFLKSPIILGFLKPAIYLPIHLISDCQASEIRYILLHELQHYRHRDVLVSYLMNLAGIVYWLNPLIWHALKEMRGDREIACDTSVLQMLTEDLYEDYGNTLINFAEKVSLQPFPFAAGIGGTIRQMRRRILNIVTYKNPTLRKKCSSMAAFALTAALLLHLSPLLSPSAAEDSRHHWDTASETITLADLSSYFGEYEGSFVLYDLKNGSWTIHDMENAAMRVSPDSTYKIYDALFALEEGLITPEDSLIAWNHEPYPFDAWNMDQTLDSAMQASVNWYFQAMDAQLGADCVSGYIQKIGYGNRDMSAGLSSYWIESSLQISPIEQVRLLADFYNNRFGFAPENVAAVKMPCACLLPTMVPYSEKPGLGM